MTDKFFKNGVAIIFFLLSVIFVYEIAGGKATTYYLGLVIFGMLVVNTDKIKYIGGNIK